MKLIVRPHRLSSLLLHFLCEMFQIKYTLGFSLSGLVNEILPFSLAPDTTSSSFVLGIHITL